MLLFSGRSNDASIENRGRAELPALSWSSVRDRSFGAELDTYVWDNLPTRVAFLKVDHWIDYHVFLDSPLPSQVIRGEGEWLYLWDTVADWPARWPEQPEEFVRDASVFDKACQDSGKTAVVVISPNKASIYPQHLPPRLRSFHRARSESYRRYLRAAAQSERSPIVDLWGAFLAHLAAVQDAAADASVDRRLALLFRPRNRHWTSRAGALQARVILTRLRPSEGAASPFSVEPEFWPPTWRQSEMETRFLKISLPEIYEFAKPRENSPDPELKVIVGRRTNGICETMQDEGAFVDTRTLVVVHDSFMLASQHCLSREFRRCIYVHWGQLSGKQFGVAAPFILEGDVIVLQSVEGVWPFRQSTMARIAGVLGGP